VTQSNLSDTLSPMDRTPPGSQGRSPSPTSGLFVAEEGRGPAVLFVHGQPGLGKDFDAVARLLTDDHRVIAPDRPGYGRSSVDPMSMAQNAALLADLVEERGAAPVTVVGHSYGGGVAVLLAASRPDLVRATVLAGSVGKASSVNGFDHLLASRALGGPVSAASLYTFGRVLPKLRDLAAHAPNDMLRRFRVSLPDASYAEALSAYGRRTWRSFLFEQRALVEEIGDVERSLEFVASPTVVVAGRWDVVVPPEVAGAIVDAIEGAELVTVEKVGHFLLRDAPRVIADAVREVEAS
jgi:pimeloyl-ACP methyl ester carboxylesterase